MPVALLCFLFNSRSLFSPHLHSLRPTRNLVNLCYTYPYLFHMKNEAIKNRASDHARLLARRSLTSKPRHVIRANSAAFQEDSAVARGKTSSEPLSQLAPELLAAETSHTSSHTASHSTAKPTATKAAPKAKHTSSSSPTTLSAVHSTTAKPDGSITKGQVSGIAIGLALGLIGLALLVIGVVWAVRRRKAQAANAPISRWKDDPFGKPEARPPRPDTSATLSKSTNRKSEGYLKLGDEKSSAPPTPMSEKSSFQANLQEDPRVSIAHNMSITPPGSTFNNPSRPASFMTSSLSPNSTVSMKLREMANVQRAFLPTLPDELHIQQGETVEIVNAFDDGWALCLNSHGEKGVVPLECLLRSGNKDELTGQEGDRSQWRLSKRASSLYSGVSPDSY